MFTRLVLLYFYYILYNRDDNLVVHGSEKYKNIFKEVIDISSEVIPVIKDKKITIVVTEAEERWLGMHIDLLGMIVMNVRGNKTELDFQKIFLHELFHQLGISRHPKWWKYIETFPHTPDLYHFNHTGDLMDQYYHPENKITNLTLFFIEKIGYHIEWDKRDGQFFSLD